ncbi:MAG TPA: DUF2142 domain-containing protein [Ktedonobacterales bacterium]
MLVAIMLVCLPLLALALRSSGLAVGWRETLLAASAVWGAFLALLTEGLGAARLLTGNGIGAGWLLLALGLEAYLAWRYWRGWRDPLLSAATWRSAGRRWRRMGWPLWAAVGAVAVVLGLTLVAAIAAPPNTPDTMTYHLARVMRWMQDASLAPFPSHLINQDIQPPWAEYALLNLHLLSGSDWLDGLVQWGCFAGCVVGVSLIAARLGAGPRGQALAAVYAATIPMAVIQAASVQNDLVVAYWLVCLAAFLLDYRAAGERQARMRAALLAGLSLGLAALSKGVAYVDALPFLLVFAAWAIYRERWRALAVFATLALLALTLNAAYYGRNIAAFGAPLGEPTATRSFSNANYLPGALANNLLRNLAIEFGGPSRTGNAALTRQTDRLLRTLGLDPADPQTTLVGSPPFQLRGEDDLWLSDAYTTNPIHMLVALLAGALVLVIGPLRRQRGLLGYLVALGGAALVFCLYLRWAAGVNRLMVGLFILAAPLVGAGLEGLARRLSPRGRLASGALVCALVAPLLLTAAPRLLYSQSRPLLGPRSALTTPREDQYFAAYPPAEPGYTGGVGFIRSSGCHQVGFLVSGPQDRIGYTTGAPAWEYPLWALLDGPGEDRGYQIADVLVTNRTASLASQQPYASFQPCAVFAILQPAALTPALTISGRVFHLRWQARGFSSVRIAVYLPDGAAA